MVTRKDVAKLAKVSPAVVSYVINDSNYVSKEKRKRVLQAIKELDYRPNYFAKGLKTQKTNHIVLIGGDIRYEQFAEISSLFEKYLYERGYYVSFCTSHEGDEYIERMLSYQPEGVIVLTSTLSCDQLNNIAEKGFAVALTNNILYENLDNRIAEIRPDSFGGISMATEYLIKNGHEKISFFHGLPIKRKIEDNYRLQGYVSAMKVKNLKPDIHFIDYYNSNAESIYKQLSRILDSKDRPTGIVAWTDSLALRIISLIERYGFDVPGDVSVIGMDNLVISEYMNPPLTTINYSKDKLVNNVIDYVLNFNAEQRNSKVLIGTEVIERGSVRDLSK